MSRARIVIVDDDRTMLELVRMVIGKDAEVHAFDAPAAALDALMSLVPDLIISDIVMPGMGGFAFRQAYSKAFEDRETPFLFLSSLDDPETMVAGLDGGADDYIVKPVDPTILRARVRRALRRHGRALPSFKGDFGTTSFSAILEFCESKGFTGEIVVDALGLRLPIRGGSLDIDAAADHVDKLFQQQSGSFVLRAATIDFGELNGPPSTIPAGRMSTVEVRGHKMVIVTEIADERESRGVPMLVSTLLAEGTPVSKMRKPIVKDVDVQQQIDTLHREVEAATLDRISSLRHQKKHGSLPKPASVDELFDQGLELSLHGDWVGALSCWERGLALDPSNRRLAINVEVARKKARQAAV